MSGAVQNAPGTRHCWETLRFKDWTPGSVPKTGGFEGFSLQAIALAAFDDRGPASTSLAGGGMGAPASFPRAVVGVELAGVVGGDTEGGADGETSGVVEGTTGDVGETTEVAFDLGLGSSGRCTTNTTTPAAPKTTRTATQPIPTRSGNRPEEGFGLCNPTPTGRGTASIAPVGPWVGPTWVDAFGEIGAPGHCDEPA